MSFRQALSFDLSPVRLNYVGAIRGLKPQDIFTSFTYAQVGNFDSDMFLCLAASNPNGQFYGLLPSTDQVAAATSAAAAKSVRNAHFTPNPDEIPDNLNFLCSEQASTCPTKDERDMLFSFAEKKLAPGGLFAYRYKAYENINHALQFLVCEYGPELSKEQILEFLVEIKALGANYFNKNPAALAVLDKAIETKTPNAFLDAFTPAQGTPLSITFESMAGLLPRQFSFVGDADIEKNYLELSAPTISHPILEKCQNHLLYEPIKDFVLQRLVRNDVWVKRPVEQTFDSAELFDNFTFGMTTSRDQIPLSVSTQSGSIQLSSPLFSRLLELMSTLPIGIGDFLGHPAGYGFDPDEVVSSIQILVACGLVSPMRGRYEGGKVSDTSHPRWSNEFNAHLNTSEISEPTVRLASTIVGGCVTLPARDALVLQAVNRVGLSLCAGILQPELKRILQKNPALAAQIMDAVEPTDDVVHNIIANAVTKGMARWYAYGLLAA